MGWTAKRKRGELIMVAGILGGAVGFVVGFLVGFIMSAVLGIGDDSNDQYK